jgi:hypothetical protein
VFRVGWKKGERVWEMRREAIVSFALVLLFLVPLFPMCVNAPAPPVEGVSELFGLELTVTLNKTVYLVGEPLNITLKVTNISNETIEYSSASTLIFDFLVFDAKGNWIYQWSIGKAFAQIIIPITLNPGDSETEVLVWDQTCNTGAVGGVSPGTYYIVGMTGTCYMGDLKFQLQTAPVQITIVGPFDVTIKAHCITEGADINVSLTMDGSFTGDTTPYTFTGLAGTHTFTVPDSDANGDPFRQWSTGSNSTSITVSSVGTYTAYYGTAGVHDVAVSNITSSRTVVGQGFVQNITVTVIDLGDFTENLTVTLYANLTEIETQETTLASGNLTTITLAWETEGFAYGNYTISGYAWPVPGQTDLSYNNCTSGWVIVSIPGDVTGPSGWPDGKVDMRDIGAIGRLFGVSYPDPRYNPNYDLNGDGKISMVDIGIAARHFGEQIP